MTPGPQPEGQDPGVAVQRLPGYFYYGEAFTFVPSFTGGSILMLGP
jgi:hypothetical protein